MNKKIIPYLMVYATLLVVCCGLLASYPKAELHLMLNAHHTPWADTVLKYYTLLAEWPLYVIGAVPLLFRRWRWSLYYGLSEGVAGLVIFGLKRLFSEDRPVVFFEQFRDVTLPLVDGVTMRHSNSFPSGHASTFFIFCTFAALLLCQYYARNRATLRPVLRSTVVQQASVLALLAVAAVGCYSRVYLSQHFLSDITVGSAIGVTVACVMFAVCPISDKNRGSTEKGNDND